MTTVFWFCTANLSRFARFAFCDNCEEDVVVVVVSYSIIKVGQYGWKCRYTFAFWYLVPSGAFSSFTDMRSKRDSRVRVAIGRVLY